MEWNEIELGGPDYLPHFFLLILGASESFLWALVVNSGVEVRSYALPVFQMKLQTKIPSPYVSYILVGR